MQLLVYIRQLVCHFILQKISISELESLGHLQLKIFHPAFLEYIKG